MFTSHIKQFRPCVFILVFPNLACAVAQHYGGIGPMEMVQRQLVNIENEEPT